MPRMWRYVPCRPLATRTAETTGSAVLASRRLNTPPTPAALATGVRATGIHIMWLAKLARSCSRKISAPVTRAPTAVRPDSDRSNRPCSTSFNRRSSRCSPPSTWPAWWRARKVITTSRYPSWRPGETPSVFRASTRGSAAVEVAQRHPGGVEAAHAVDAAAGWRRRRAEIDPPPVPFGDEVRIQRQPGPEEQLQAVVGAAGDVAPDVVRVVPLEVGRGRRVAGHDDVAETRGEPFELALHGLRPVDGRPVGDVGVGPERVPAGRRPAGVEPGVLHGEEERPVGMAAGGDLLLGGLDLVDRPAHVHRPRPARPGRGPGD